MKESLDRLYSVLSYRRGYWRILSLLRIWRFQVAKINFESRISASHTSTGLRIVISLVLSAVPLLFFSSLVVAVFLFGVSQIQQSTFMQQWPVWLASLFQNVDGVNREGYDGFLITIVTITGIFLTLYFTGITTIAGTLYAKMPEQIRSLLVQEKVGNVYTRLLILLTVAAMLLLVIGVTWDVRPRVLILLMSPLGLVSILAFVRLGERAFNFFDPTLFVNELLWTLERWSSQATIYGSRWHDPSFQNHYRRLVDATVKSIGELVELCHVEEHLRQEPLSRLLKKVVGFVPSYQRKKRYIPHDSRWYQLKPRHQKWFLTSSISVNLAAQTQTDLRPELQPDRYWIERYLLELVIKSFSLCLKDGRIDVSLSVLNSMLSLFENFGEEGEVTFGYSQLASVSRRAVDLIPGGVVTEPSNSMSRTDFRIVAVFDHLGLLPINLLLGFMKHLENMKEHEILTETFSEIDWRRPAQIYTLKLPAMLLERLEFVQERLDFEINAESKIVSPKSYLQQLIIQPVAQNLERDVETLIAIGTSFYLEESERLKKTGHILGAVTLISHGLQYCHKLLIHMRGMKQLAERLDRTRFLQALPWPEWNWESLAEKVLKVEAHLVVCLGQAIPELAKVNKTEEVPDYLGKAVHYAGEYCFKAAIANDTELLSNLFPLYFNGALGIRETIREDVDSWEESSAVILLSEPLIDLCELSGHVYLLAEIHEEPELWQKCLSTWDEFFDKFEGGMQLLANTISYYRSGLAMSPRSVLRTGWQMQVQRILETLPRIKKPVDSFSMFRHYLEVIDHASLLVQVMGGTDSSISFSLYSGLDVFVDLYLRSQEDAHNLDFGRHGELLASIERWRENEEDEDDKKIQQENHL